MRRAGMRLLFWAPLLLLAACSSQQMTEERDRGPDRPLDVSHIPDAVPRAEVRTRAGNKSPYTVLGKTYRVLPDSRDFVEEGIASWYGKKFHGRTTSNGEIYSMYGMTAAHKELPIPSYVRVTNLNNGRQIVVRVNDRGPFHEGRVIDLTYAGASKLGFVDQGTAPVRVEAIEADSPVPAAAPAVAVRQPSALEAAPAPANAGGYQLPANTFLQAGAFSSADAAESLQQKLAALTDLPVQVMAPRQDKLYRVRIGPIADNLVLMDLRSLLETRARVSPHVVYD